MKGGMQKHRKSGRSSNHANTIAMNRERQKELEAEAELARKQKGEWFSNIRDLFKN